MGDRVAAVLAAVADLEVPLQPCIRDIWHDHVLFRGSEVTGLIDFGSLRVESVAADVARLMGSLVGDDVRRWQLGLEAYAAVRRMSDDELQLMKAFDLSTVLMAGLNWLDWIYRQRRQFSDRQAVLGRVDEILHRVVEQIP
jgi:homoserine kinase type II